MSIVAQNCLAPGIVTLLANLIKPHHFKVRNFANKKKNNNNNSNDDDDDDDDDDPRYWGSKNNNNHDDDDDLTYIMPL